MRAEARPRPEAPVVATSQQHPQGHHAAREWGLGLQRGEPERLGSFSLLLRKDCHQHQQRPQHVLPGECKGPVAGLPCLARGLLRNPRPHHHKRSPPPMPQLLPLPPPLPLLPQWPRRCRRPCCRLPPPPAAPLLHPPPLKQYLLLSHCTCHAGSPLRLQAPARRSTRHPGRAAPMQRG